MFIPFRTIVVVVFFVAWFYGRWRFAYRPYFVTGFVFVFWPMALRLSALLCYWFCFCFLADGASLIGPTLLLVLFCFFGRWRFAYRPYLVTGFVFGLWPMALC